MVPSCLFRKQPYLDSVPLPLIMLDVNLVMLRGVSINCLEKCKRELDGSWVAGGVTLWWFGKHSEF